MYGFEFWIEAIELRFGRGHLALDIYFVEGHKCVLFAEIRLWNSVQRPGLIGSSLLLVLFS